MGDRWAGLLAAVIGFRDRRVGNRVSAMGFMLSLLGILFVGAWLGLGNVDVGSRVIVNFELAGSESAAEVLVRDHGCRRLAESSAEIRKLVRDDGCGALAESPLSSPDQIRQAGAGPFRTALWRDFIFILGYGAALIGACLVASRVFSTRAGRRLGWLATGAAVAAVAGDVLENAFLLGGLSWQDDFPFQMAAAFATIKFSLLLFSVPVALVAFPFVFFAGRGVGFEEEILRNKVFLPWPVQTPKGDEWPSLAKRADVDRLPHPTDDGGQHSRDAALVPREQDVELGFCLSGGGIRSACFALGALQKLRTQLRTARYLVSVSGGGYMSGAMQLSLYPDPPEGETQPVSVATPEDVYDHGSVEEDHTRRHGNYIADGAREMLVAAGVLGRGLLASFTVIGATVVALGVVLSHFYARIPLAELRPVSEGSRGLAAYFRAEDCETFVEGGKDCIPPSFPGPQGFSGWTVFWVAVVAVVVWLFYVALIDTRSHEALRLFFKRASRALWSLAVVLAVLVFVIPTILWGAAHLSYLAAGRDGAGAGATGAGKGALLTLLAAYAGSLASILWRNRKKIATTIGKVRGKKDEGKSGQGLQAALPNGISQYLLVWVALAVVIVSNLLVLAATIITGHLWNFWVQLAFPAGLLVINLILDQTWMSLHPFYRRRLATAFSVRRVERNNRAVARAYDFEEEGTPLHRYGRTIAAPAEKKPDSDEETKEGKRLWPQVIFACAANATGNDRTPPGRRAVSYTMSHDFIGGPDVGYAPTEEVTDAVSGHLAADLTVQAAVAISGAAFASAMGRQARAFQTLLAISNARLGTWLPNPAYLYDLSDQGRKWWQPGLPRIRGLSYLFREIFGRFPHDDRLLLVTDGGHYDNLGLVELLRHRCRNIYCIDASGDTPPFPQTLAEAITLAWEELSIKIELEGQLDLVPGSAEPLAPEDPLKGLSERLSASAIAVGKITYPEAFSVNGGNMCNEGRLIYAKALLTPEMPPELIAYAQAKPVFPRDATGDQWFSADQFDAYQLLGQYVGEKAAKKTLLVV